MAQIEIDGKKIEANPGEMLIEVADAHGIPIPRFCYHKKLSIAANCRMCLVEVEKSPKALPACATPVTDGMKVWTKSKATLDAQKAVMEFLLINHPLDCPICDQGGECELQDLAMGYGKDISRFTEGKRVIKDKNIGPLIATDMTRCIQCTRCVRFGTEIAGQREMGATGRGEHMEIGTFIEKNVESEVSGNIIDLCPVGALTSKPFRFKARGWELTQNASIAPHDCVGSNVYVHSRRGEVLRVIPKDNESINEMWLSDRDRFSYEGCYHPERLKEPKVKKDSKVEGKTRTGSQFETTSWTDALMEAAERIRSSIQKYGPESVGALISPTATTEECYLIQKWLRALRCNNIDHRLRQQDFRSPNQIPPSLGIKISELEHQSVVLLVGSDIHKEQPILGIRLRSSAAYNSGKMLVINPYDAKFHFDIDEKLIVDRGDFVSDLAKLAKAILANGPKEKQDNKEKPENVEARLNEITQEAPGEVHQRMAKILMQPENGAKVSILFGALAIQHPEYSNILALGTVIAEMLKTAKIGVLSDGANSAGAVWAGATPNGGVDKAGRGKNVHEMIHAPLKCYVLFGMDPDVDCIEGRTLLSALKEAESVISVTTYESEILKKMADVLLPMTPYTETSGTFVNVEGAWQSFRAAVTPYADSRPGWKIIRVLGNIFQLEGFEFDAAEEVLAEIKMVCGENPTAKSYPLMWPKSVKQMLPTPDHSLIRIANIPLYSVDPLVRHSIPLQNTIDANPPVVTLHPKTAERLKIQDAKKVKVAEMRAKVSATDEDTITLPLILSDTIPENSVRIEGAHKSTVVLGAPYQTVHIQGE